MSGVPINGNLAAARLSYGSNCRRPRGPRRLALHLQPKRAGIRRTDSRAPVENRLWNFYFSIATRRLRSCSPINQVPFHIFPKLLTRQKPIYFITNILHVYLVFLPSFRLRKCARIFFYYHFVHCIYFLLRFIAQQRNIATRL